MHKLARFAGATLVAAATLMLPGASAHAQGGTASGACGPSPDMMSMNNAHAEDFEGGGTTVPALFYRVDYSGVSAPTRIGVFRYYNDMQVYQGVSVFTVQEPNGSIGSAVRANINPETQGGEGSPAPGSGRADGPVTSQRSRGGAGASGYGGGGGLMPGEYIFHVYTGVLEQTPNGPQFNVSSSGYLGEFTCGVQD